MHEFGCSAVERDFYTTPSCSHEAQPLSPAVPVWDRRVQIPAALICTAFPLGSRTGTVMIPPASALVFFRQGVQQCKRQGDLGHSVPSAFV